MTDDGLTETQRAFLSAQYHREAFTDMSPADINRLDMSKYARLTGRQTPVQAAIQAAENQPPGRPRETPAAPPSPAPGPQGTDFASLGMAEYGRVRDQLGIGRSASARGLFD
jgi:hypothetical protein